MKIMIIILGALTILTGILPALSSLGILPAFIPTEKPGYQFIIISIGILGLLYGVFSRFLFGIGKFVTISLALLTILGGILPFMQNFMPAIMPTSGAVYYGLIIAIGIVGISYGFINVG